MKNRMLRDTYGVTGKDEVILFPDKGLQENQEPGFNEGLVVFFYADQDLAVQLGGENQYGVPFNLDRDQVRDLRRFLNELDLG